jgi:hypothetical protein
MCPADHAFSRNTAIFREHKVKMHTSAMSAPIYAKPRCAAEHIKLGVAPNDTRRRMIMLGSGLAIG